MKNSIKYIKLLFLSLFAVLFVIWASAGKMSGVFGTSDHVAARENSVKADPASTPDPNLFVGSQTCQACHESEFDSVATTKHGKLETIASWKDKVTSCESCHGPGKEHVEAGGDITKIISFKNKTSKEVSETCLACHSGSESHNKFRRSDHWRNNVGCTDCHTAHGPNSHATKIGSISLPGINSDDKPGTGTLAMLKTSEPQLCLSCHSEQKADFSKPFHHKVLEGQMKCSDCHSAHGGFELKNARLSVGADSACIKCHSDKQGPFVYEHLPITTEGCAACHTTHGSTNAKMLKRNQVRQLCLECHTAITESLAPGVPSFHNQASVRTQNCTTCHSKIHGSQTHPFFFR
ncbi:MAG: cytochrome C [Acidobacteria bacterium]|nr:cytochrome C [Acidobacteriota bacterium]